MSVNLSELTSRVHHHGYARGVVVMDPSDFDALIYEIETLRSRLNDLQESTGAGLRRARSEEERESLVGKFFEARDRSHLIRVVDYMVVSTHNDGKKETTFLVAYHHPDGRARHSNSELFYGELVEQYNLDSQIFLPDRLDGQAISDLRRARSVDERVNWIGHYFQSRDKPKVLCKVVDYEMKSEKFYITLHYPDGSTFYQQAELSYDEIVQYYNMDNPVTPKPHFTERT